MNTKECTTNKLSIYLIKEELSSTKNEELIKNCQGVEDIDEVGEFHYGYSQYRTPHWLKKFFGESFYNYKEKEKKGGHKLFSATASGVLLVNIEKRKFAITFGYGHNFLNDGVYEERFGLKSALNLIEKNNFKAIEKKNMSMDPKLSIEQVSKNGDIYNFELDTEQDLVLRITGQSNEKKFGNIVTGKDFLSISAKYNINNIKKLLSECLELYKRNKYKKNFGWIDHIKAIKSKEDINKLNNELVKKINSRNFDDLWMSIPDIIEWENISEFRFNKRSFGNDIDLETYLSFVKNRSDLSLASIKNHVVECISADGSVALRKWKVYRCLYCEIKDNDKINILSGGQWYEVERYFTKKILASFDKFRKEKIDLQLPQSKDKEPENVYNKRVGEEINDFCCMDCKLIPTGVTGNSVEFGDLLTTNKEIIHVKKYGASSVLSHLFAQGMVSGILFNEDEIFRANLSAELGKVLGDELAAKYKAIYTDKRPSPDKYKVIYAIISKHVGELEIPFFSKIYIRNIKRKLEGMGYDVYLYKIPVDPNDVYVKSDEAEESKK